MTTEKITPEIADVRAIGKALTAPFHPDEVKFKPQTIKGNRALALAYVDARVIQDRLDDVLGVLGWQDSYKTLEDGSVLCRLRIRLGTEWITKMDVGSQSEQPDGGDRLKAAFSDALKRAAVKFGIGRYLYRLPQLWADYDPVKRQFPTKPKLPAFALPEAVAKPAKTEQPAKPVAKSNAPSSGQELMQRLRDYDAKLSGQGLCAKGALIQHVTQAGVKAGHGADLGAWTGPAIALAIEETKAYETKLRQQPQQKAVA